MAEKYLMFDLEDDKSSRLGEAISNPNCKKIINLLAERELTATEISRELNIQLSALDYNLKKLIDAGIIEKSKHFWSVKGKKIPTYRVVNKVIVIQPKKMSSSNVYSKLKTIMPLVVVSAVFTAIVAWFTRQDYSSYSNAVDEGMQIASAPATTSAPASFNFISFLSQVQPWMWFALGALIVIIVYLIWNWNRGR